MAELDRFQASVGPHCYLGRDGIGQSEIVCRRDPIDENFAAVAPGDGVYHRFVVRGRRFLRELINMGNVVEALVYPSNPLVAMQPVKGNIDGGPCADIDEIAGGPSLVGWSVRHSAVDLISDALHGWSPISVRNIRQISYKRKARCVRNLLQISYKIVPNPDAVKVKMQDLRHNCDVRRLKGVTQKDHDRMARYHEFYLELASL